MRYRRGYGQYPEEPGCRAGRPGDADEAPGLIARNTEGFTDLRGPEHSLTLPERNRPWIPEMTARQKQRIRNCPGLPAGRPRAHGVRFRATARLTVAGRAGGGGSGGGRDAN